MDILGHVEQYIHKPALRTLTIEEKINSELTN